MKRLMIDDNYLVPVKSNCDGTLVFSEGGYDEGWCNVGEVQMLPWKEVNDIRRYKRSFFKNNWIIFEPTDEYTASQMYEALGVSEYYPDADAFKSLDEIIAMKPKQMNAYLQEIGESYRTAVAVYAKGLYQNSDPRMDSKSKREELEKVLGIDFDEV